MTDDEIIRGNLDLLNELMKVAFEQPEIFDKLPSDAELIILPENDPELYKANLRTKKSLADRRERFVILKMKIHVVFSFERLTLWFIWTIFTNIKYNPKN